LTTNGFIIHIPAALARHRSNPGCSAQQPLTARATLSSILPNRAISGSGGAVEAARIDLQLSSGSLRALRLGPESGAPVLCVPGLSANARSFDAVARRLAERGRAVVVVDLRGRGFSPATSAGTYGWRRHAEDVLEAARSLRFASIDLVGHSMGAFVSMQAAALEPARVRRLVLIDAAGVPEPAVIPPILAALQRLDVVYPSAEAYCDEIRRAAVAVPWELWGPQYLYDLEPAPGGVRSRTSKAAVIEDAVYGGGHDARQFWEALRMPVLLLRAARPLPGGGFVVGAQLRDAFLAAVPSGEVAEVDANHYGVMADPEALRAIDEFLARPPAPAP
jgi:pimeloyl-ACP methyl ester carboxylesterase